MFEVLYDHYGISVEFRGTREECEEFIRNASEDNYYLNRLGIYEV